MSVPTISFSTENLVKLGLTQTESIHYQSSPEELVQDTLRMGEGILTDSGALAISTGEFTGRSPKDKFTVKDELTTNTVHWNEFNIPIEEKYFHIIHKKIMDYLSDKPELWIRDCYACADERYRLNIRVVTEKPWTNLFAYNMFLRPEEEELDHFKPHWHVMHLGYNWIQKNAEPASIMLRWFPLSTKQF
jgi:phosphoenolpyruvate carboxykinase (ATP)